MTNRLSTLGIVLSVAGVLAPCAAGQDTPAQDPAAPDTTPKPKDSGSSSRVMYSLEGIASYSFSGSMDDSAGEVDVTRIGAKFGAIIVHDKQWSSFFDASTQYSVYNFEGSLAGFTPGGAEPFDNLYSAGISIGANYAHDDHWTYTGALRVSTGFGDGGEVSESLTYGGVGGFTYGFAPNVRLGLGIVATTRLDDEFTVFPVPIVDVTFEMTDRLRLDIGTLEGVRLGYEVSDTFEVGLGVSYDYNEYRLGNSGPAPGGVFRETTVPLMLEGVYVPNPDLEFRLGLSTLLYGDYELDDSNGLSIGDTGVSEDVTLHFGVRYSW